MSLAGLLIDTGTVPADTTGLTAVALIRRHEPDGAVAVPMVVPVHEFRHPAAGFFLAAEGTPGVVRSVLDRAEQLLRVGVVVTDPRSGEGSEHAELLQPALQRGGSHGVAVVGMEDQRLGPALADPLSQAGPADQIRGDLGVFPIRHVPGHHLAAPDVDHQIEVQPDATDASGQVGDVPAPELIGPSGLQARHGAGFLGRPGTATAMDLAMGMEHPVEAALRADVDAAIGKDRHDLARRQRRELRLVAGEQDPLALLVREAVRHHAVAAFAAIQTDPITRELPPPALQRGQPDAQQSRHLPGSCTSRHSGIEDLQGLAAILSGGQSSPSSPQ